MSKRIYHDFKVQTCDDFKIEAGGDFSASEQKSAANVRRAIAKRLGVPAASVQLVKNEENSEPEDENGYGCDTFDVLVNGEIRPTVWVDDDFCK